MNDNATTTLDLTARSEAFRADTRAVVTKTRDFATEIWSDIEKLGKDGYQLAVAWVTEKRSAAPTEVPTSVNPAGGCPFAHAIENPPTQA